MQTGSVDLLQLALNEYGFFACAGALACLGASIYVCSHARCWCHSLAGRHTDLNACSRGGYTALHLACVHGQFAIQVLLREHGADESRSTHHGFTTTSLRQTWVR